jgi:uncharacterized membrane protein
LRDVFALIFPAALRLLGPLALIWLAYRFGTTLRAGCTPLIEQVARRSKPMLPAALCRYTRVLTALWCAYFVLTAVVIATASADHGWLGLGVWAGTLVLFAGERMLRPWWFPDERFPGLAQQLRDTLSVWRHGG